MNIKFECLGKRHQEQKFDGGAASIETKIDNTVLAVNINEKDTEEHGKGTVTIILGNKYFKFSVKDKELIKKWEY